MKKILMISIVFLFFVSGLNAQVRDDDSYFIYFSWTDARPDQAAPGGYVFYDSVEDMLAMTAVRTNRSFNVYARNNSPDAETGAKVVDHSAYPSWYSSYGWDVPDADASWTNGTRYLISLDTVQNKWWLFYVEYPYPSTKGVADIYVPMSGTIHDVEFNEADNTVDIHIDEDNGDWKCYWVWGVDNVKLQNRHFIVHLDLANKVGYIAPESLVN
ncbi:hypothetical protein ACFLRM_07130 [Acidobacteriota bacterium]